MRAKASVKTLGRFYLLVVVADVGRASHHHKYEVDNNNVMWAIWVNVDDVSKTYGCISHHQRARHCVYYKVHQFKFNSMLPRQATMILWINLRCVLSEILSTLQAVSSSYARLNSSFFSSTSSSLVVMTAWKTVIRGWYRCSCLSAFFLLLNYTIAVNTVMRKGVKTWSWLSCYSCYSRLALDWMYTDL